MANDCLVTQLNGVVDDNSLSTLGVITLEAVKKTSISDADKQQCINFQYTSGNSGTIKVTSPGAVGTNSATVDQSTDTSILVGASYTKVAFKNETYKIFVPNKYKLRYLIDRAGSGLVGIFGIDLSELDYAESLEELNLSYNEGVKGNIKNLSHCPLLTAIKLTDCSGVTGDIKDLTSLTSLSTLQIRWTKITGELTELAAGQVSAGRTSGTLAVPCTEYIKLNGVLVGDGIVKTITFDSSLPNGYSVS